MKVLIAAKETKKEFFDRSYGYDNLELACAEQEQELQKVLDEHSAHHSNLESLISAFKSNGIEPVVKARVNTSLYRAYTVDDFKAANVIVSFGGDGEVLDVARMINRKELGEHSPLVWVERADPSSVLALAEKTGYSHDENIKRAIEGRYRVETWSRLKGVIKVKDRVVAENTALNDIYFGDVYRMGTARYTIQIGDKKEYQMSSGGIISSQVGMQGWLLHVRPDLEDKERVSRIDKESRALDYIITEPMQKTRRGEMLRGQIPEGQKIVVVSAMNYDGGVSFDASKPHFDHSRCYEFNRGMMLEVSASDDPLRVIRFDGYEGKQDVSTERSRTAAFAKNINTIFQESVTMIQSEKKAELHLHTTYSDGVITLDDINRSGLDALAITDHDTIEGFLNLGPSIDKNITLIPGIEFSSSYAGRGIHVLAYGFDTKNPELQDLLDQYREKRVGRALRNFEILRGLGYSADDESVNRNGTISKPNIARIIFSRDDNLAELVKNNIQSIDDFIDNYLVKGAPAFVPLEKIPLDQIRRLCKGPLVLAHPGDNFMTGRDDYLIAELNEAYGLAGIEVYTRKHTPAQTKHYLALARRIGLFASAGSDAHHPEDIGSYAANEMIVKKLLGENYATL